MARGHGEGSIVKRPDGRWMASLQVDGRRRVVYGRTRAEANRRLSELRQQAGTGVLPDPGRRQVNHLLDLWLEQAASRLRPTTLDNYRCVADKHIRPAIGALPLSKLTPERVARLYREVAAQGRRLPVIVHVILRGACRLGLAWHWLAFDPTEAVKPPTYRSPKRGVWSREQLHRFLEGSREHRLGCLWRFMLASGLRVGEATALRWGDVDWEAGSVQVHGTLVRVGGAWHVGPPKTQSAHRTIALPPDGLEALREQRRRQLEARLAAGPEWRPPVPDLVFTTDRGAPLHRSTVVHALQRQCERLGVPALTSHRLRALHVSLALEAGVPVAAVARRVGHTNAGVTWESYARAVTADAEVAQALQQALSGRR